MKSVKINLYSFDELMEDCKEALKELMKYEEENRFQIKYYKTFWNLLIEY